jgi:S1-C subfamily serine protease
MRRSRRAAASQPAAPPAAITQLRNRTERPGAGDSARQQSHQSQARLDRDARSIFMDQPEAVAGTTQPSLAEPARPPRRRRSQLGLVLAVSILSASLASATTALVLGPAASPEEPAATAIVATSASTTGATTGMAEAVVAVADAVGPAVVTVNTTSEAGPGSFGRSVEGVGSGVLYTSDGFVLTAAHVVEGASSLTVTLADGRELPGTVVAIDTGLDLAVLRVDGTDFATAVIGSSSGLRIGQAVVAIGSALGTYEGSVTSGVLSGTDRSVTVSNGTRAGLTLTGLLQTDAAINEGDSGGPLVDMGGHVIGIITAGSTSAQGLGFAVPIDAAATLMQQAAAAT